MPTTKRRAPSIGPRTASTPCSTSPPTRPSARIRSRSTRRPAEPITRIIRFHRTQSVRRSSRTTGRCGRTCRSTPGLRYEGYLNIYNTRHDMANIEFTTDEGDLRTRLSNAKMVERHYYLEGGLWNGGMHTFAPRASFAWDPDQPGEDVDPRRDRAVLRSDVEPDLGQRVPEPARCSRQSQPRCRIRS